MVFLFKVVLFVGVVLIVVGPTTFFSALNLVVRSWVTQDDDVFLTLNLFGLP